MFYVKSSFLKILFFIMISTSFSHGMKAPETRLESYVLPPLHTHPFQHLMLAGRLDIAMALCKAIKAFDIATFSIGNHTDPRSPYRGIVDKNHLNAQCTVTHKEETYLFITPLQLALLQKDRPNMRILIEKLIEAGANPYVTDALQKSAFDYAKMKGRQWFAIYWRYHICRQQGTIDPELVHLETIIKDEFTRLLNLNDLYKSEAALKISMLLKAIPTEMAEKTFFPQEG